MKRLFSFLLSIIILCGIGSSLSGCTVVDDSVKLSEYNINVKFDGKSKLSAIQRVTYVNNTETALNKVLFKLYPNAFREDSPVKPIPSKDANENYYNGFSEGFIEISTVRIGNKQAAFSIEYTTLTVPLPAEIFPDEEIEIELVYEILIPDVIARFGNTGRSINLGNWYPVLCVYYNGKFIDEPYYSVGDPFLTETADYTVNLTVPGKYIVASSGRVLNEQPDGKDKIISIAAEKIRDFAIVLSDCFRQVSAVYKQTKVTYFYLDDKTPDKSLKTAQDAIEFFTGKFGGYPYTTYSVVETALPAAGMEYTGLVYINPKLAADERERVIVHETAHQWWYGVVGSNSLTEAWQDEGLTEYSTLLYFENKLGADERNLAIKQAEDAYRLFADVVKTVTGELNTKMSRALNEFFSEYEYVYITYFKGMLMFDNIREIVGDAKFFKSLERYYDAFSYKLAAPDDIIGMFEKSGCKSESIFRAWIDGKVIVC